MKHGLAISGIALATAFALAQSSITSADCGRNPSPFYDSTDEAAVVVSGRFTGWAIDDERWDAIGRNPAAAEGEWPPYQVRVELTVDHVYKGNAALKIDLMVESSVLVHSRPGGAFLEWVGGAATCTPFFEDPTGQYGVIGFKIDEGGEYRPGYQDLLFIGDEAGGESYDRAQERLSRLGPARLPEGGGSDTRGKSALNPTMAAIGSLVFLAGAAFLWRRGEPHNG
jgi:hypothetical protein